MREHDSPAAIGVTAGPCLESGIPRACGALALTRMFVSVDALFAQLRRRMELGPNERLAMEYLWEFGPMPMSDLADRLAVTRAAVTTLVDRMIEAGLLVREADMHDRRRTIVSLSPEGLRRGCAAIAPWRAALQRIVDDMSEDDWDACAPLITALHEATRQEGERQRAATQPL